MPHPVKLDHEQRIALFLMQSTYLYQLPQAPEAAEVNLGAAIHLLRGESLEETIAFIQSEQDILRVRARERAGLLHRVLPVDTDDEELGLHLRDEDQWRLEALGHTLNSLQIIQQHPEYIGGDQTLTYKELEEKYA